MVHRTTSWEDLVVRQFFSVVLTTTNVLTLGNLEICSRLRCVSTSLFCKTTEGMTEDSSRMMTDLNVNNSWPSWLQIRVLLRQKGERGYSVCGIITLELRRLFISVWHATILIILPIRLTCIACFSPIVNSQPIFMKFCKDSSWVICRIPWNFHQKIFYSSKVRPSGM